MQYVFVILPIVNYNNILINTVAKPHFKCRMLIRSLTCGHGERPTPHKSDSHLQVVSLSGVSKYNYKAIENVT